MGTSTALSFAYYSTVYSAIQDVVPAKLRGTAVSLYFFAMYVLGATPAGCPMARFNECP